MVQLLPFQMFQVQMNLIVGWLVEIHLDLGLIVLA